MSLNAKLFLSFLVMVILGSITGIVGWRTVQNLEHSLGGVVGAEMPINGAINSVSKTVEAICVAQRTLLDLNLGQEMRKKCGSIMTRKKSI